MSGHGARRRVRRVPRRRGRSRPPRWRCWCRSAYLRREQLEAPEYFALMLFSALGMVMMTTANDLIVVFLALEVLSIPLYVLAAFDRRRLSVAGSRHQVLRARRVLVGDLPVRHRARVRRHRHHLAHRHRAVPRARTRCSKRARCWPGSRCCSSVSASRWRRCRSTCGRPTCTRARPRRSPRSWPSATKAAAFAALLRVFRSRSRSTATDWRPVVWVLAVLTLVGRQHRRGAPDRRQATARVLVDRARRLRAHGRSRPPRPRAARRRSSTCSCTRSW